MGAWRSGFTQVACNVPQFMKHAQSLRTSVHTTQTPIHQRHSHPCSIPTGARFPQASNSSKLYIREGCAHCRRPQRKIAVGLCRGMLRRRFPKSQWGMGRFVGFGDPGNSHSCPILGPGLPGGGHAGYAVIVQWIERPAGAMRTGEYRLAPAAPSPPVLLSKLPKP